MKFLKNIKVHPKAWLMLMIAIFAVMTIGLLSAVSEKMNSQVQGVEIELASTEYNNSMISVKDLSDYVNTKMPELTNVNSVKALDLRKLEEELNKHPQVHNADAFLNRKNIIEIKVYQKEPVYRIFDAQGGSYYLDYYGDKMPLSSHYTARIPVVVLKSTKVKEEKLFEDLLKLKGELKGRSFLDTNIDQLVIDEGGSITMIPMIGSFVVKMGTAENLTDKLDRLEKIYKEKLIHKGWDYYKAIDLRFSGQVVAQKKDGKI